MGKYMVGRNRQNTEIPAGKDDHNIWPCNAACSPCHHSNDFVVNGGIGHSHVQLHGNGVDKFQESSSYH